MQILFQLSHVAAIAIPSLSRFKPKELITRKPSETTVYNVKVIAPKAYADSYEMTHESLGVDLQKITKEVENQMNSSVRFVSNDMRLKINLESPANHPITDKLDSSICEGSVSTVTNLLNEINNIDAASHYIVLLPCSPMNYTKVFESIHIDVPIIHHSLNVQCTSRVAIFQETKYDNLMATFGNALIRVLGNRGDTYSKLNTLNSGDSGIKVSMTINEDTIHEILNSKCFFNIFSVA